MTDELTLDQRLDELRLSNTVTTLSSTEILNAKAKLEQNNAAFLQLVEDYKTENDYITSRSLELITFTESLIDWVIQKSNDADDMHNQINDLKAVFTV